MLSTFRFLTLIAAVLVCFFSREAGADTVSARFISVIDGDTIVVKVGSQKERLRLIGIDTPESRLNERAFIQSERSQRDVSTVISMGQRAKDFLAKKLLSDEPLRLEFDVVRRDKYGRLLAYAYRKDGTQINELMLAEGFANTYSVPPNLRYANRFRTAEKLAREAQRGLWATPRPEGSIRSNSRKDANKSARVSDVPGSTGGLQPSPSAESPAKK